VIAPAQCFIGQRRALSPNGRKPAPFLTKDGDSDGRRKEGTTGTDDHPDLWQSSRGEMGTLLSVPALDMSEDDRVY